MRRSGVRNSQRQQKACVAQRQSGTLLRLWSEYRNFPQAQNKFGSYKFLFIFAEREGVIGCMSAS